MRVTKAESYFQADQLAATKKRGVVIYESSDSEWCHVVVLSKRLANAIEKHLKWECDHNDDGSPTFWPQLNLKQVCAKLKRLDSKSKLTVREAQASRDQLDTFTSWVLRTD